MINTLFLDVDGVLADFISPAMLAHGMQFNPETYPRREWNVESVLGVTQEQFWAGFDGYNFWRNLKPYPYLNEFISTLITLVGKEKICLLTSPSQHHDCIRGKKDWLREHVPELASQVLFGKDKYFCAGSGKVLVDDSDANCKKFSLAGGMSILFPRVWNDKGEMKDAHLYVLDAVEYLVAEGVAA